MINHTNIVHVDDTDLGVQVTIGHGRLRGETSEARKRGQAKWAMNRLWEQGRNVNGYRVTDVRSNFNQTQVSFKI